VPFLDGVAAGRFAYVRWWTLPEWIERRDCAHLAPAHFVGLLNLGISVSILLFSAAGGRGSGLVSPFEKPLSQDIRNWCVASLWNSAGHAVGIGKIPGG